MATTVSPLREIGNLTAPLHAVQHDGASSMLPLKEGSSSLDTDLGVATASESECDSGDDLSIGTDGDDDDGAADAAQSAEPDDSFTTISPRKRHADQSISRQAAPIFFGTPSKAEHERRSKYHAKLRTRRLLRKDSIELTRRKSGGWEGHEASLDDRPRSEGTGDDDVGETETHAPTADASSTELRDEESAEDDAEAQDQSGEHEVAPDKSESPSLAEQSYSNGLTEQEGAETINAETSASLGMESIDPDATEEADWFGQRAAENKVLEDIIPLTSLPSTPVRHSSSLGQLRCSRPSLALSDADSSPGIALALHPISNRPSPILHNRGGSVWSASTSPYTVSPGISRFTVNRTSQREQENYNHAMDQRHASMPAASGSQHVLRESQMSGNSNLASSSILSPVKIDVRQKLAAWAETRAKTPQSPEKREWDQLRASIVSQSPSVGRLKELDSNVMEVARHVPLPLSPEKDFAQHKDAETNSSELKTRALSTSNPNQASSVRQALETRQSRLPIPAVSKLPRPFKQTNAVAPAQRDEVARRTPFNASSFSNASGSFSKQAQSGTSHATSSNSARLRGDYQPLGSSSSLSNPSLSSSPQGQVGSRGLSFSSSSPSKQAVRASAPIVRDARMFGSKAVGKATSPDLGMKAPISSITGSLSQGKASDDEMAPDGIGREMAGDFEATRVKSPNTPSDGVGGARRVMLRSVPPKPSQKDQVQSLRTKLTASEPSHPQRRLGMRSASKPEQVNKDHAAMRQSRPIRRINDFVNRAEAPQTATDPFSLSSAEQSRAQDRAKEITAKDEAPREAHSAQKTMHGDDGKSGKPIRRDVHAPQHTPASANPAKALDSVHPAVPARPVAANQPRPPLPLSSAELSRLTSLHTQRNEVPVTVLHLKVIRKQGEMRPASPSSKFRNISAAASGATKGERIAQEAQARRNRAAQRSARSSSGDEHGATDGHEKEDGNGAQGEARQTHRMGAGDVEVYASPFRRISLKKFVRWHRDLFAVSTDANGGRLAGWQSPPTHASVPRASCLSAAKQPVLDRFGNTAQAGQPLRSPAVRRRKIIVTRIVYDDDDDANGEEGAEANSDLDDDEILEQDFF